MDVVMTTEINQSTGQLRHCWSNVCLHKFTLDFLNKVANCLEKDNVRNQRRWPRRCRLLFSAWASSSPRRRASKLTMRALRHISAPTHVLGKVDDENVVLRVCHGELIEHLQALCGVLDILQVVGAPSTSRTLYSAPASLLDRCPGSCHGIHVTMHIYCRASFVRFMPLSLCRHFIQSTMESAMMLAGSELAESVHFHIDSAHGNFICLTLKRSLKLILSLSMYCISHDSREVGAQNGDWKMAVPMPWCEDSSESEEREIALLPRSPHGFGWLRPAIGVIEVSQNIV
ncbi:hypothetical protein GUJ93_ZPchr0013g35941 [Zizania palustris]|uniref:Uncharacterized protein n=1 Tax=Zizania palustris TaxID=103762 RepID=A0A8J5WT06_ZIZPA|nr:hypothetical protein GUJ93_ZPchr0013g35941 [Zizania palustris]